MSVSLSANRSVRATPRRSLPQRIAVVRALLALAWAAALLIAIGGQVTSTSSDLPTAAALVLASYPAIDVVASIATALGTHAARRVLWINAAISALAVAAVAATAFGADAGASLVAFGAWAALSGTIQLGVAVHRRRANTFGAGVAMARILIVGAGVVGLGAGLPLCGDGHEVTVLERDAEAAPTGAEEIWGTWQRKGVNQFRLSALLPGPLPRPAGLRTA